jgi:hypothetical protein
MRRRHPDSWPAVDTCFLCWCFEGIGLRARIHRAAALYIEREIPGRNCPPRIKRPMALCIECAYEHAARCARLGCLLEMAGDIPPRLTRAGMDAAIARLHSGADLPSEPRGADLRQRGDDGGDDCRPWSDNGPNLPGDGWKR